MRCVARPSHPTGVVYSTLSVAQTICLATIQARPNRSFGHVSPSLIPGNPWQPPEESVCQASPTSPY
jgi:hypothetical protein